MASDPQPPSTVPTSPLHVAILLNSWRSKFLPAIRTSYVRVLAAVAPHVALTFFETAEGQFPDPGLFDLVVLSGANVDARRSYEWILRIHEFLRRLVAEYPQKKIVGICWGHQAISRMYGGEIADMDVPEMGVTSEKGRQFFPHPGRTTGILRLQQHHRREVSVPPPGFIPLAHGNQILLHENNTILTFQGHPEKDAQTARLRMQDSKRWFGFDASDEQAWNKLEAQMAIEHDGHAIWKRILQWVAEPAHGANVRQPKIRFIEYQGHPFAYDRLGRSGRVGAEQSRILLDLAQRQHALA